jgi:hypothetical protein
MMRGSHQIDPADQRSAAQSALRSQAGRMQSAPKAAACVEAEAVAVEGLQFASDVSAIFFL